MSKTQDTAVVPTTDAEPAIGGDAIGDYVDTAADEFFGGPDESGEGDAPNDDTADLDGWDELPTDDDAERADDTPSGWAAATVEDRRDAYSRARIAGWSDEQIQQMLDTDPDRFLERASMLPDAPIGGSPTPTAPVAQPGAPVELPPELKSLRDKAIASGADSGAMAEYTDALASHTVGQVRQSVRGDFEKLTAAVLPAILAYDRSQLVRDIPDLKDDAVFDAARKRFDRLVQTGRYKSTREALEDATRQELAAMAKGGQARQARRRGTPAPTGRGGSTGRRIGTSDEYNSFAADQAFRGRSADEIRSMARRLGYNGPF